MSLDRPVAPNPYDLLPPVPSFTVTSTDVTDGAPLGDDQVAGRGQHLARSCRGAVRPEGTQSYVVTCFDPDAPTPSGFWHWVLVDVPADVTSLDTGAASAALPGKAFHVRNDGGDERLHGCGPAEGRHAAPLLLRRARRRRSRRSASTTRSRRRSCRSTSPSRRWRAPSSTAPTSTEPAPRPWRCGRSGRVRLPSGGQAEVPGPGGPPVRWVLADAPSTPHGTGRRGRCDDRTPRRSRTRDDAGSRAGRRASRRGRAGRGRPSSSAARSRVRDRCTASVVEVVEALGES